jgi:uncharacterized protein YdaU (DUF1376 family)
VKWYKHDPDAFIAGTAELTLQEVGTYILIIDLYYSRDGNVPDDDAFMVRALRCDPRTWRVVKTRLISKHKLRTIDGNLTPNRAANELRDATERIARMSQLGRKSAEKRKQNNGATQRARSTKASVTTTSTTTEEGKELSPRESSLPSSEEERAPPSAHSLAPLADGSLARSPPGGSPQPPTPPAEPKQEVADDEQAQRLEIIKRRADREPLLKAILAKHEMDRTPFEKMILKSLQDPTP